MDAISKLTENIKRNIEGAKQAQIRFAECTAVQWEDKTMTATGCADGSEYFGVALGLGGICLQPAIGSVCLIGIIEGFEVSTFLIQAEKVELCEINSERISINGGENEGAVKVKELTARLNEIEMAFNSLLNEFSTHNHTHPQGATVSLIIPPTTQPIQETEQAQIENENVKH